MFDIGFGKLALIAVVALLVLGPERLPRVARTAGALIRRARNSWASVRSEIERELATDDIKRSIREAAEAVDIRADVNSAANSIHDAVRKPMTGAPPAPSSAHSGMDAVIDPETHSSAVDPLAESVDPATPPTNTDSDSHERR